MTLAIDKGVEGIFLLLCYASVACDAGCAVLVKRTLALAHGRCRRSKLLVVHLVACLASVECAGADTLAMH